MHNTKTYKLRDHEVVQLKFKTGDEVIAVKLKEGPFEGLVFSISHAEFAGTESEPVLKFDYVLHVDHDENLDNDAVQTEIGDFLMASIERDLKNNDLVIGGKNDGTDDSFSTDEERELPEEGVTIS